MKIPLLPDLLNAAFESVESLKSEITEVKPTGFSDGFSFELIEFKFKGKLFRGVLNGRNRDLCLGFGELQDKAIAARVFLDGQAKIITN